MKLSNILILIILIFSSSCSQHNTKNLTSLSLKPEIKYSNIGFALIYNNTLNIKKLDNRSLLIFHKNLKNKSLVKISNPINNKSVIAEVKSNRVKFSDFYNSVISNRIAEVLELDFNEPYVEINSISKNSTFVAKKSKTFEEEKQVAEKAPIDGIKISNLNKIDKDKQKLKKKHKFSYSIKVADFYYKESAQNMIKRIKKEVQLNKFKIMQMSETNYRLILGPFNDIDSLKKSFEKINFLYFDNLEILKNA